MEEKKLITVFGATGAQGGGLVRAILNDPQTAFRVRAVTRDRNSERARVLESLGAEIFELDLVNGYEAVRRSLEGAFGAFFVTFYWHHTSPERELLEAEMMAKAAKEANVRHVIWSSLEDTREFISPNDERFPTIGGKYKVPHFDGKGEADHYFKEYGVPTTFLYASFYWENFIHFGMEPKRDEHGTLTLNLPLRNKKMAGIAAEDIGRCAYGIFKAGDEYIGKTVGVAGEQLTGDEYAEGLEKALNEKILYRPLTASQFRSLGFPAAEDLGNMFQFYDEFEQPLNNIRDVALSRILNPALRTFSQWVEENHHRIPLN